MSAARYLADCHCHSDVSPDGHCTMTEMALSAAAAGLDELCFTDHVEPYGFRAWDKPPLPKGSYDWGAMVRKFREAQEAVGGRLTLRMGAELGDATLEEGVMESFLDAAPPLDFTIGSVHVIRTKDGTLNDLYDLEAEDDDAWHEACTAYFDEVDRLLDWGRFCVLGHLTLPQRYAKERHGVELSMLPHTERIENVLRRAIDRGIGIECNTNRGHQPLPDERWLRMYREMHGEIITVGSDAHTLRYVGCAAAQTQELLAYCGFRYFTTFTGGKPEFHKL